METHNVVLPDEWTKARIAFLAKEKELTHRRDALAAERRELPWMKIEKEYVFDGPNGQVTLSDLFDGRRFQSIDEGLAYIGKIGFDEMRERGVLLATEQLHPTETATTVRCWDGGDIVISGGPFAQTKEQLSGFFIVECKDLDEAIDVATRVPAAWYGAIEVRPVSES